MASLLAISKDSLVLDVDRRLTGRSHRGGWTSVFCRGRYAGCPVGVKLAVNHPAVIAAEESANFLREVEMLASLRHPQIVAFYGYVEEISAIVLEYPEGGSLKERYRSSPPIDIRLRIDLAVDIAEGMAYLHSRSRPVIHRDLKGDNVFLTRSGGRPFAKLGGFGGSTWLQAEASTPAEMESLLFVDPSLYSEPITRDVRSDVYSFAVVLTELASWRGPYGYDLDDFPWEWFNNRMRGPDHLRERPNLKERIGREVPPAFISLIEQCWRPQRRTRPLFVGSNCITVMLRAIAGAVSKRTSSQTSDIKPIIPLLEKMTSRMPPRPPPRPNIVPYASANKVQEEAASTEPTTMDWRDDYTTDNETETFAVPADDFTEVYVECAEEGSAKAAVASDDCSETEASESSRTDEAHVISSRNSLVPETSASVVGVDEAGGESKHGCGFEAEQDEVVNVNTQGRGIVASEHLRRESVVETGGIEEDEEQKGASKVSAAGGEGPAEAVDGIETAIGEGEFYDEDGGASKEFRRNVKKVGDDFPKISPDLQVDDTSDGPDVKPEIHNPSADGEFIAKVDDTVLPKIRSACGEIMCQQQCDEARQQTLILSLEGAIVDVRVMAKFNEVVKVPGVTDGVASDEAEDLETKRKYEALEARDAAACEQGKNSKTEVDILDIEEEVAHGEPEVKTAKESETTAGFAHEEVEDSQGNGRRSWDPRGGFATAPIATQADQVNESLHSTKFALENGCIRNDSMAGSSPLVEIGLTTESPHREPSLEQCQAPPSSDIEDAGATSPEIRRQLTVPDVWIRKSNVVASQVVMDSHITKVDSDILAAQDATDVQIALADFSPTDESPPSQSESYDYKAYQSTSSDIDMPQVIVVAQSTDGQRDTMATQDADDFEATHENPQAEPVNQPDRDGHFDTPTVPSGELTGHFDDYNQEPLPAKIAVPAHQSSTSDDICRIEDAVKTIGVREVESYLIPPMEVDTISRVVDLTSPDRIDLTAENSDGEQACEQSHIPPSSDVVAPPPIIMHHRRPSTVFVRRRLASRAIATQILNDSQITQADYDFLSPLDASEFYVAPADPFAIKESSLRPSSAHRHSTISQWTVTGAQQRASNRSPFQLVVDLQSTPLKPEDPTGQGAYDSDITQADPPVADEPQSQLCGHGCVEGVREPTAEHTTQQAQSPCPDGAALTVTRRSTCDNTGPDIYYSEELEDDERADSASEVDGRISLSHLYYENTVAIGDMVIFNDGVQDADLNDEDDDATEGEPEPHDSIEISVHDAAKDINLVVIGTIAIAKDAMIQSEVVIAGAGAVQCETPLSTSHCKISAKALLRVNHETIAAATTRGSFNDDANSGIADSSGVGELRNDDGANNGLATQVVVEGLKATYRKSPKSVKERDLTPKSAKRRDTMPQSIKREDSKLDCLEPSTNAEEYTGTSAKVLNARPGNYGTEFTVLDITEARDPDTQKKTRDQGLESQESLDFFNISSYRTPKRGPRSYSQKIVGIPSDVRRVAQRDRRSAIPQSIQTQPANDGRDRRPWPKTATPRFYEELAESGDALTKLKIGLCYYKGSVVKQDYNRAAELFRDAADAGDVRAKFNLGVCYKMGQGVKRNLYKAAELYEEAAVAGDPHAKACLGNLYYKGEGVAMDFALAVRLYKEASEHGDLDASFNLAVCYHRGDGVSVDLEKAAELFRVAAKGGHTRAKAMLAACYERGEGVGRDLECAVKLYIEAADAGDVGAKWDLATFYEAGAGVRRDLGRAAALYRDLATGGDVVAKIKLGICYYKGIGVTPDCSRAASLFGEAADAGDVRAKMNLAVCLETGGEGLTPAPKRAARLYRELADTGVAAAKFKLGDCYRRGHGVLLSLSRAVVLYREASDGGDADGAFRLATCYRAGVGGLAPDFRKAAAFYGLAAGRGHVRARACLARCYEEGEGVRKDWRVAAKLYRQAAEAGDAGSMFNFGLCCLKGRGVKASPCEAARFFRMAAELGDADAMHNLSVLYEFGQGVERDPGRAAEMAEEAARAKNVGQQSLGVSGDDGWGTQASQGVVQGTLDSFRM